MITGCFLCLFDDGDGQCGLHLVKVLALVAGTLRAAVARAERRGDAGDDWQVRNGALGQRRVAALHEERPVIDDTSTFTWKSKQSQLVNS